MRIQFISKKYMPAAGGSERSIHALLLCATLRGHEVEAVVQAHPKHGDHLGPVRLRTVAAECDIERAISLFTPDVVFTQIDWNGTAVECARQSCIPVVHFSHVGDANLGADLVVFNSNFVRGPWIRERPELKERSLTLYPTILPHTLGPPRPPGDAVLCINPVRAKGGVVIAQIASLLPKLCFLATLGWCEPTADGVDFSETPNVRLVAPRDGIADYCAESFVLLVPSLWNEPFGRVIVEAMSFGLPVVAYRRGGIPEAMGGAGLLLPEEADAGAWVQTIQQLATSPQVYSAQREAALNRAARYPAECDPAFFFERLLSLVNNYSGPQRLIGPSAPLVNSEWFLNLEDH